MPVSKELVEELCRRRETAKSERSSLDSLWESIREVFRPSAASFTSTMTPGTDRLRTVYDAEPANCASELARAMAYALTPKGQAWAAATTEDEADAEDDEASGWLERCSKRLLSRIYDPDADFEKTLAVVYPSITTFGASVVHIGERRPGAFMFRALDLKDVHWLRDYNGQSDTVFVRCEMTARQARQREWNSKLVAKLIEDGKPEAPVTFLEATFPRHERNPASRLAVDMPFAYVVIDPIEKVAVYEGGYHEMPYCIPEWEVMANGDIWSPARLALPDAKMLQQIVKTLLRQSQFAAEPMTMTANDALLGPLRRAPGANVYYDASQLNNRPPIEVLNFGGNVAINFEIIEAIWNKIRRIFMLDVIRLPEMAGMTATEVMRRNRDFAQMAASPFGRFESGLTQPLVERCFGLLFRQSATLRFGNGSPFPPPPDSLAGANVSFKFFNEVSRAQQAAETSTVSAVIESLTPLIGAKPDLLDNFESDLIVRDVIQNQLAAKYVKPMERVIAERKARAEAIEEQAQNEAAVQQSEAVRNVTPALTAVAGGQQGRAA